MTLEDRAIQALKAVVARYEGLFDDPDLVAFGDLCTNYASDMARIAKTALRSLGELKRWQAE